MMRIKDAEKNVTVAEIKWIKTMHYKDERKYTAAKMLKKEDDSGRVDENGVTKRR